jgi:hypothetical protein
MSRKSLILIFLLLLVAVPCVLIYRCASEGLEAEATLHANEVILGVVKQYIHEHPGRWPGSWDDLKNTAIPDDDQVSHYRWPDDIEEYRKRFDIRFGLTLEEVAEMVTFEEQAQWEFPRFTAVRPKGPHYWPPLGIPGLLKEIRSQLANKQPDNPIDGRPPRREIGTFGPVP